MGEKDIKETQEVEPAHMTAEEDDSPDVEGHIKNKARPARPAPSQKKNA